MKKVQKRGFEGKSVEKKMIFRFY